MNEWRDSSKASHQLPERTQHTNRRHTNELPMRGNITDGGAFTGGLLFFRQQSSIVAMAPKTYSGRIVGHLHDHNGK